MVTEAQPLDPVTPSVLLVDSAPVDVRPGHWSANSHRVPSLTRTPGGGLRDVNISVVSRRWTVDALASEIERGALAAAESAGLVMDRATLERRAHDIARRELGWRGALGRLFR